MKREDQCMHFTRGIIPSATGIFPPSISALAAAKTNYSDLQWTRAYIIKRENYMSDRVAAAASLVPVKRHLEKVANAELRYEVPVSYEYELMLARYSNYSMWANQYEDAHEQEVLEIIQSKLGIQNQSPLWYWDCDN
ncbi:hypothetical protein BV25DRAFT_365627 [Artomyces pyxidatus]|uniref:Uncharacterized protein n=1 Tax=Artomyces pyxidatus TaxID=48021 RepID=A0ACB8T6P7_9AGAM|nr:hypothetical protein BV25DRAFT_365627 [Artomyces pyxidatus]